MRFAFVKSDIKKKVNRENSTGRETDNDSLYFISGKYEKVNI